MAAANARAAIHNDEAEILFKRGVLKPIVHDDGVHAQRLKQLRACGSIPAHHRRRGFRQKQRLVANPVRAVRCAVDQMRTALAAAIAAREKAGLHTRLAQQRRKLQGHRRLARAAHREIADADDRKLAAVRGGASKAPLDDLAIDRRDGPKRPCGEAGCALRTTRMAAQAACFAIGFSCGAAGWGR